MPTPRKTLDAADTAARLDGLRTAVRREAEGAEADPFDDAMLAALHGAMDALEAEPATLRELEARLVKLARRAVASE